MKKRLLTLMIVSSMLLSLASCGNSTQSNATESSGSGSEISSSSTVKESGNEDVSQTYLFTDDAGREVEIPKEITRIVPSAPLAQIILFAIASEQFVGLATEWHDTAKGIIGDKYFDLPCFGSLYVSADLNVEELALAEPQIIIDMGEPKKSIKEDLDNLQNQTNIPSVYVSSTLESMPETYRKLGKLLGKEEKGEQLAQFCEKIYNRTTSIMEKVGDNKIDTLYVIGKDGLNVLAKDSYHSELLDMLTNNVAVVDNPLSKGTGNEVTMEQISLWNPDFVIFAPDSIYDTVKQTDSWNKIDAIINDKFVKVPAVPHNWMSMPPAVQRYLGLIWLTAELYPEYCDYDVKADIMEYYELFYNCKLTDEQYNTITKDAFLK